MALIICKANVLSLSSSSSFSSSSSPSAAVGAASNWRYPIVSLSNLRSLPAGIRCAASPASQGVPQHDGRPSFRDFPYASAPVRDLMGELFSMVETRLGPKLVPRTLPPDVEYYTNESGTNHGCLYVRAGSPPSPIDFLLGSWRYYEVPPEGVPTHVTMLRCFMNSSTYVPELVVKLAEYGPTSLGLTLDFPPRKDVVLSEEYTNTFYVGTELDNLRKCLLCCVPGSSSFREPFLYLRCAYSPTAITVAFRTSERRGGGETTLEEVVREAVKPAAKKVVETWLDFCVQRRRVTSERERARFRQRDIHSKSTAVQLEIMPLMPEMFGQEIADRVYAELDVLVESEAGMPT